MNSENEKENHTKDKEEQKMYATVEYRKLDLSKLKSRKRKVISTEDSLRDIVPIQWSDEVISGQKKVVISKENNK